MCENVRDVKDAIRKEWNMQTGQLSEAWAKAQVIFCFDRGNWSLLFLICCSLSGWVTWNGLWPGRIFDDVNPLHQFYLCSASGFSVGNTTSVADILIFHLFTDTLPVDISEFPKLAAVKARMVKQLIEVLTWDLFNCRVRMPTLSTISPLARALPFKSNCTLVTPTDFEIVSLIIIKCFF